MLYLQGVMILLPIPAIHGEFDIPAINAVGFLTGFGGEEEFIDEVLNLLEESE